MGIHQPANMGTTKAKAPAKAAAASPGISRNLPKKTFVLDNGAYTMKAGYAPDLSSQEDALSACTLIPNALVKTRDNRIVIGAQLATQVTDWNEAAFRRPVEKGYIVNWEAEREIWEQSFFDEKATARNKQLRIAAPEETTLVLTEGPNTLPVLQRNTDEMVMEEWGFGGYARCLGKLQDDISTGIYGGKGLISIWQDRRSMLGMRSTLYSETHSPGKPTPIFSPRIVFLSSIRDIHIPR
jgi:hypothetical protein